MGSSCTERCEHGTYEVREPKDQSGGDVQVLFCVSNCSGPFVANGTQSRCLTSCPENAPFLDKVDGCVPMCVSGFVVRDAD